MVTANTLILSVKIVLMSTGVVFIAILLSLSLQPILSSATSELPSLWSSLRSWLRPPYLYFIINGIIITIVASSRLHHHHSHHGQPTATALSHHRHGVITFGSGAFPVREVSSVVDAYGVGHGSDYYGAVTSVKNNVEVPTSVEPLVTALAHHNQHDAIAIGSSSAFAVREVSSAVDANVVGLGSDYYGGVNWVKNNGELATSSERGNGGLIHEEEVVKAPMECKEIGGKLEDESTTVVKKSTWTPPARQESSEISPVFFFERPPATSRFSNHRRPAKASPVEGGRALRVAKPKRHETVESTWKTITEGRHIPLTRHLKKSDTWENHSRQINLLDSPSPPATAPVKKSETFKDRTNCSSPHGVSSSKLKKEPSLSQDELNRRVEAFINKFNEEMRLQRQQSIQQYMEMINRAA